MGLVLLIAALALIFFAKNYPVAALLVLITIITIAGVVQHSNDRKRKEKEEDERIAAEEAAAARLREAEEARIRYHQEKQTDIRNKLVVSCDASLSLFESLPQYLISAEKHLDQANNDFAESAFAPFWDSIENAANMLGRYDEGVRKINGNLAYYYENVKIYEGSPQKFPLARLSIDKLTVGTATAERMKAIVKNAQRNFQFAMIYEQRKTNQILVAGFTNLAQALDRMSWQISSSISDLAGSVDSMTSTISESAREAHAQYKEIADANSQYHDELVQYESERATREKKALEMLDNIQRHRKPRF